MTDKELLEFSAKAVGAKLFFATGPGLDPEPWIRVGHSDVYWNPLKNDGDALRLAVRLRLDIEFVEGDTLVIAVAEGGFDKCQATRRAIVRAAAMIGQRKES